MVGVDGREGAPFKVYRYVKAGYCEVEIRRDGMGRDSGREIVVEECEVGLCD